MAALSIASTVGCQFEKGSFAPQPDDDSDAEEIPDAAGVSSHDAGRDPGADAEEEQFVEPSPEEETLFALIGSPARVDGDLSDWSDHSWVSVSHPDDFVETGEASVTGPDDFSARMAARWSGDRLYLALEVVDDEHENDNIDATLWMGDSVQVAFDMADDGGGNYDTDDDFELGWALLDQTPGTFRWFAPLAAPPYEPGPFAVFRDGGVTYYEIELAATDLGLDTFVGAGPVGFSMITNEDDGDGREGFLEWSSGIGANKQPVMFGSLVFYPEGP